MKNLNKSSFHTLLICTTDCSFTFLDYFFFPYQVMWKAVYYALPKNLKRKTYMARCHLYPDEVGVKSVFV